MREYRLHLDNPAKNWENSSPVGNGFMGASVFGRTDKEQIVLNEETVWDENHNSFTPIGFSDKIAHIRELFAQEKNAEAFKWAEQNLDGDFQRIASFEVAGTLILDFDDKSKPKNYRRDLLLTSGLSQVEYEKKGAKITQECFASYPQKIIALSLKSDKEISFAVKFDRPLTDSVSAEGSVLLASCHTAHETHRFCVGAQVLSNGKVTPNGNSMRVEGSTSAVIFINISTDNRTPDFKAACLGKLNKTIEDYETIKAEHIADYSAIMSRSDIRFPLDEKLESKTVGERLTRLKLNKRAKDFGLISLYWQFGKYLLIGSSRPGSLPANLQGVWGERMENPWNADYHTNINLQMNYWQAEQANISECTQPLFDYMNTNLLEPGRKVARDYYGCNGTVTHHLSDIYGFNAPADGIWGLWPMGGAWLAYHMWEHYLYTNDTAYLKNTAYNFIKASAEFFLDYMVEDKNGRLLTGPSASPENSYIGPDGQAVCMCMMPTMDIEIVGGLLKFYCETEKLLDIDSKTADKAAAALKKLPPLKIGKFGQLMEWLEDYEEADPGHRHISHAFGLYPGAQITRATPEFYKAINTTLERRLANGGGHTGWSRAWLINLFARLRDGENAYENLIKLFTKSTLDNLFDTHPPFQIDGNFGGAAAIGEMLVQSHEGFISLLPAVTDKYSGSFSGFKARGNIELSAEFDEGRVTSLSFAAAETKDVKFEIVNAVSITVNGDEIHPTDGLFTVHAAAEQKATAAVNYI